MRVYLASGFFSEKQIKSVKTIEKAFSGYQLFSPRLTRSSIDFGEVVRKTDKDSLEKKEALSNLIYHDNITYMDSAELMVANIDDFDPGVMFEIGYASSKKIPILTLSFKNYGLNIMIAKSSFCHIIDEDRLFKFVNSIGDQKLSEGRLSWLSKKFCQLNYNKVESDGEGD